MKLQYLTTLVTIAVLALTALSDNYGSYSQTRIPNGIPLSNIPGYDPYNPQNTDYSSSNYIVNPANGGYYNPTATWNLNQQTGLYNDPATGLIFNPATGLYFNPTTNTYANQPFGASTGVSNGVITQPTINTNFPNFPNATICAGIGLSASVINQLAAISQLASSINAASVNATCNDLLSLSTKLQGLIGSSANTSFTGYASGIYGGYSNAVPIVVINNTSAITATSVNNLIQNNCGLTSAQVAAVAPVSLFFGNGVCFNASAFSLANSSNGRSTTLTTSEVATLNALLSS